MRTRRAGFTLPELLIALACAAVLFAVVGSIALRQQRLFAELAESAAMTGRLREAMATLPIELRGVSPAAGDIREARDTSLEFRATIATAVVCDAAGHSIVLGPRHPAGSAATFAAYLTPVVAGDTAWLLGPADSIEESWVPRRITGVSQTTADSCARGGPVAVHGSFVATTFALDTMPSGWGWGRIAGTVLRVTRPARYSLYRSGDGSWQLGAREWNTTTLRLNTIQPVAGPLLPPSGRGLVFSYFDTSGNAVANPSASPAGLALIRVAAHAQASAPARVLGSNSVVRRADSLDAAVFLHNRR